MACIYNLSHVLSPGYVWHATLLQIWFVSDTAQNLTKLPTRKLLKWPTRHCCPTVALHTTACIYEHCFPIATNIHLAWKGFSINCHISWQLDHWRRTKHGNYNSIALHGLQDAKWSPWLGQDTQRVSHWSHLTMNQGLLWHQWNLGNTSLETHPSYSWIGWFWITQSTLANLQVFLLQVWCRTHTFHTRDPEAQLHLLLPPLLKLTIHQSTTEFEFFKQCRWTSRHLNFKQELQTDYSGEG